MPNFRGLFVVILLAGIFTSSFALLPWPRGDDYRFHISVWRETASRIKHLNFPRWNGEQAFGLGEPTYIFYPPLSIYLGALITLICGWQWAAPIFCGSVMLGSALSMRICASRWLKPEWAWVAALLYCANPYLLLCFWVRSSFAETLVAILFPLLIYIISGSSRYRLAATSLLFTLIWLSNLPAAVIASYATALYVIVSYLTDRDKKRALQSFLAMCLGLGIAAFQLWPAAREMHLVQTDVTLRYFSWSNSFLLEGAGPIRALIFAFFGFQFMFGIFSFYKRTGSAPIIVLGLLANVMLFRFSTPLWRTLPFLANVQFPTRWLFVVAFVSILVGLHVIADSFHYLTGTWLLITALGLTLSQCAAIAYWTTASKELSARAASMGAVDTSLLVWEYLPRAAIPNLLSSAANDQELAHAVGQNSMVSIQRWEPEYRELRVRSDSSARLTLRLLNYLGWQARINGQPGSILTEPGTGRMVLLLAPGSNLVEIRFLPTHDRNMGLIITLISLTLCAALNYLLTGS